MCAGDGSSNTCSGRKELTESGFLLYIYSIQTPVLMGRQYPLLGQVLTPQLLSDISILSGIFLTDTPRDVLYYFTRQLSTQSP